MPTSIKLNNRADLGSFLCLKIIYKISKTPSNPIKINTFHEFNEFNSNNTYKIYSHRSENSIKNIHITSKNQDLNKLKI